jgi:hypothetical protein
VKEELRRRKCLRLVAGFALCDLETDDEITGGRGICNLNEIIVDCMYK